MSEERKPFFSYGMHRQRVVEMMCLACSAVFRGAWIEDVDAHPFLEKCPGCGVKAAQPIAGEA
jgi:hypothetical protein